jgi:hypothetical protein
MFFPASQFATYGIFLFAIFIEAIGLSFLETSGDTYATLLGPKRLGTLRLNISQTMNALGLIVGILLGKYLVFQDTNLKTEMTGLSKAAAQAYGTAQLSRTLSPYKYVLIALGVLIILFVVTKFPTGRPKTTEGKIASASLKETLSYLSKNNRYKRGILTQFIYIGAQTGIWSFTMRLALNMFPSFSDRDASNFMLWSYAFFFVGRFFGSYLLSKFRETRVLAVYLALGALMLVGTGVHPQHRRRMACGRCQLLPRARLADHLFTHLGNRSGQAVHRNGRGNHRHGHRRRRGSSRSAGSALRCHLHAVLLHSAGNRTAGRRLVLLVRDEARHSHPAAEEGTRAGKAMMQPRQGLVQHSVGNPPER